MSRSAFQLPNRIPYYMYYMYVHRPGTWTIMHIHRSTTDLQCVMYKNMLPKSIHVVYNHEPCAIRRSAIILCMHECTCTCIYSAWAVLARLTLSVSVGDTCLSCRNELVGENMGDGEKHFTWRSHDLSRLAGDICKQRNISLQTHIHTYTRHYLHTRTQEILEVRHRDVERKSETNLLYIYTCIN